MKNAFNAEHPIINYESTKEKILYLTPNPLSEHFRISTLDLVHNQIELTLYNSEGTRVLEGNFSTLL